MSRNSVSRSAAPRSVLRRFLLRALFAVGAVFVLGVVVLLVDGWTAFGARAQGVRLARMHQSPRWSDDRFVNPQPMVNDFWRALRDMSDASPYLSPAQPLEALAMPVASFATAPASGLRVTWFGHSTTLVEIDGVRVLTDPVWSDRVSPTRFIGPRRWSQPQIALDSLPHIDAVVISHDHYDHLDYGTVRAMRDWTTVFIVPLGVGAHLEKWGIPSARIVELDWWQTTRVTAAVAGDGPAAAIDVISTPARHASGRILVDNDKKLWTGFALVSDRHRVWYSGDTGLFPGMTEIGEKLGPFDLTMIEVGQYGQAWPDWHLGPEQAVRAHGMVKGRVMLPVHWGMFTLAYHGWTEPMERTLVAGATAGATILTPRLGQLVEPGTPPAIARWWPTVAWKRGEQDPIVASKMDGRM